MEERDKKDRSVSWLVGHHAISLLRLAHIANAVSCRAAQTVMAYPKQIPDGMLEVVFSDKATPDLFLLEVETYPEQDTLRQIRRDLAMVLLSHDVLADTLVVVLAPKGNQSINAEQVLQSARGLTQVHVKVEVLNLWTVPAEEILKLNDENLLPLLPLTKHEGPPEELLQICVHRIEKQAPPQERENLLAMTFAFAEFKYNKEQLLKLLGGSKMSLTIENALFKTPAGQRMIAKLKAEHERDLVEKLAAERAATTEKLTEQMTEKLAEQERATAEKLAEQQRENILQVLRKRFTTVPGELTSQLKVVQDLQKLNRLLDAALECADLNTFQAGLGTI
jgi:hypothetical protein